MAAGEPAGAEQAETAANGAGSADAEPTPEPAGAGAGADRRDRSRTAAPATARRTDDPTDPTTAADRRWRADEDRAPRSARILVAVLFVLLLVPGVDRASTPGP